MNWLLVIAGALAGAPLRYCTDRAVQSRHDTVFPWGTFAVESPASYPLSGGRRRHAAPRVPPPTAAWAPGCAGP